MILGGASPAMAQSFGGGDGGTLVIVGALGAGLALGLFIFILFAPTRGMERDLSGRLGVYADAQQYQGFFARMPILRRFARQAESVARDRGVFSLIETALEQANVPLRPGEAITIAIGIALALGAVVFLVTGNPITALIIAILALALAGAAESLGRNTERGAERIDLRCRQQGADLVGRCDEHPVLDRPHRDVQRRLIQRKRVEAVEHEPGAAHGERPRSLERDTVHAGGDADRPERRLRPAP